MHKYLAEFLHGKKLWTNWDQNLSTLIRPHCSSCPSDWMRLKKCFNSTIVQMYKWQPSCPIDFSRPISVIVSEEEGHESQSFAPSIDLMIILTVTWSMRCHAMNGDSTPLRTAHDSNVSLQICPLVYFECLLQSSHLWPVISFTTLMRYFANWPLFNISDVFSVLLHKTHTHTHTKPFKGENGMYFSFFCYNITIFIATYDTPKTFPMAWIVQIPSAVNNNFHF